MLFAGVSSALVYPSTSSGGLVSSTPSAIGTWEQMNIGAASIQAHNLMDRTRIVDIPDGAVMTSLTGEMSLSNMSTQSNSAEVCLYWIG